MASGLEGSSITTPSKQDIGWKHCEAVREGRKVHVKCLYCTKMFKGGGIHRFKEHLAGRKGGGPMCQAAPPDVRLSIQQHLDDISGKHSGQKGKIQSQKNVTDVEGVDMCVTPLDSWEPFPGVRTKKDLAWGHCQMIREDKRVQINCKYCGKLFKGGGIHRFKEHLAGRNSGGVPVCEKVTPDVRLLMQQNLNEIVRRQKKKKKKKKNKSSSDEEDNACSPSSDGDTLTIPIVYDDVNTTPKDVGTYSLGEMDLNLFLDQEEGTGNTNLGKKKRRRGQTSFTMPDDATALHLLGSKVTDQPISVAMGRLLYDIGACLDAVDLNYFQPLFDMIASGGKGVSLPMHHDLRGCILKKLVEEVKNDVDQLKTTWGRTGCSILVEELNSENGRTLLNFLVYCSKGTVFLKSVDVSGIIYSPDGLYELLKQVVEEVGAGHVLQVITNGERHYAAAGKRLMDTFPLFWAPCAAWCIDMILDDFGKVERISAVIEQARTITRFVYNCSAALNLMRKFTYGNDIVQQGVTRSATNFMTLKRLADFKLNLQTMVTSQEWMDFPYSKQLGGLSMLDIISNRSFWTSCILIVNLTSPLLRLLGVVCSEKRAAMAYVFSGMYRAKETIKKELVKAEDYMVYWNIIDTRCEQQRQPPLHGAGFFLNPKFFYSIGEDMDGAITSKMFDCIERLVPDDIQDKIIKEIYLYKNADGDLGRKITVRARETLLPAEWWSTYAGTCPNLARLAIRILSQTCSSIGCKPTHIPFEKVYVTGNCLERQRLIDTIFVQYNLRLKQLTNGNKSQIPPDPISFNNVSILDDWISQNEFAEDCGSPDWMSLVPPPTSTKLLGSSIDEIEDMGSGFGDSEIVNGLIASYMYGKELEVGNGDRGE